MVCVLDFESFAIQARPEYPPKPVGLAIYMEDSAPFYMSWGHPTNNNCTEDCAKQRVIKCLPCR